MSVASTLEREMLALINQERTSRGLKPLKLELRLNEAAEDHSDWMGRTDNFSHSGAGGSSPGDRMRDAGFEFSGSWSWAENIAWVPRDNAPGLSDEVRALHNNLMNSPGHRKNLLNPDLEYLGLGIELGEHNGNTGVFVTQKFAKTSAPVMLDTGGGGGTPGGNTDDDILVGRATKDILAGGDGNDTLRGKGGNDILKGQADNDLLYGGNGNDRLYGGTGNDKLIGGRGKDKLYGGEADDVINGGGGNDKISGGSGRDTLIGGFGADDFIFTAGVNTVRDFGRGKDQVSLASVDEITSFRDLRKNHMHQSGDDVRITDGKGNWLILEDVSLSDLDRGDFIF